MKDNELVLTIIRDEKVFCNNNNNNVEDNYERHVIQTSNSKYYDQNEHFNENGIEIEIMQQHQHDKENEDVSPLLYQPTANKTNLNSLNTKKMGKKIHIQLIKGPQGLGFKLAARDNPTGEISPIYVKNILPKGAAIIDGRLQRGDRLLEVNGMDMTIQTLHEAVNVLRNTRLGSLVDIVVSRQLNQFPRELVSDEN
jgi:C-terminal processing protease CtpA/Prc